MKLPNWLKIVWWFVLFGFVTYLMSQRYNSFISGSSSATDIIIFLIWIALFAVPIFQQVSFFGVGLKKEFDNLKSEVKEQIVNLRSDIQNTINMRADISPHITFLTPPPDSELPSIEERIRSILEQTLKSQDIEKPVPAPEEPKISDDIKFLFGIRWDIETKLRRIWKLQWAREAGSPPTIPRILSSLADSEILHPDLHAGIRDVYAICSAAIHGGTVSKTALDFVRDLAPGLIASLRVIEKQLGHLRHYRRQKRAEE